MFTKCEARELLTAADVFFGRLDDDIDDTGLQTLNMSDVWGWALADFEYVPDEDLPRVAELFWRYGWCGILFWVVSKRRDGTLSEFHDVNRFIEFVANEEKIRAEMDDNKLAYTKRIYSVGG